MFLFADAEPFNLVGWLFDFKSNVINFIFLVGVLWWLGARYLPPMFAQRRESIETALRTAAESRQESQTFLAAQKTKVARAEEEVASILADAKQLAEQLRMQMEEQTKKDMEELLRKIQSSIANERQLAITEMRAQSVRAAMKLSESYLSSAVSEDVKATLLNQFMEQLESLAGNDSTAVTTQQLESTH